MQQGEKCTAHPVIFDSDKKLRFGVSNSGEFVDNVYREQGPSKLVGRIIGRNQVQMNAKSVYTTADIVCEAYLHKRGSWMQNWKCRYFVLRKDIRSICYYDNRESLTLLGSIPLDSEIKIKHIAPKDSNGFEHVIAIEAEGEYGGAQAQTYIRFDNVKSLKSWVMDIRNEALNLRIAEEEQQNWWSATFDKVAVVEIKSNAVRRENETARNKDAYGAAPARNAGQEAVINSMMQNILTTPAGNIDNITSTNESPRERTASEVEHDESDVDSDNEGAVSEAGKAALIGARSGRPGSVGAASPVSSTHKRKFKLVKVDKPPGPPPYESPTAKRFEGQEDTLTGLQVSLKLCNVCGYQDRIFVVLFGNMSPSPTAATFAAEATYSAPAQPSAGTVTGAHDIQQTVIGGTGSKWTQISRTELRTVDEKPVYRENYVSDFRIHFSIVQDMIPESCKEIRFVVYRQENEMNYKEPSKACNLNMQLEMAKCIIPKKMFDSNPILKVAMQVKMEIPMDIAVPLFKEAQVVLGVARVQSRALYRQRAQLNKALKIEPYSEILYTFATTTGKTLSLEQLFASKYSVSVAQALLNMWQLERNEYIFEIIDSLKQELDHLANSDDKTPLTKRSSGMNDSATVNAIVNMAAAQAAHAAAHSHAHGNEEKNLNRIEHFLSAVSLIEDFQQESLETTALVLENCNKMVEGKDLVSNVIDSKVGGGYLRRSTWVNCTAWQYCATNLNLHFMLTKHFTFAECMAEGGAGSLDPDENLQGGGLYCTPTITMGVPAAHELKFTDGGLRKLFHEITDNDQKLRWINAIQAPTMDLLKLMLMKAPGEARSLFGAKCNMTNNEDIVHVLKRKMEISRRLDICASQALGSAVASVRIIVTLAAQLGGKFMDILSRSLRIGFCVMFQSMLSTQGAELGMIEDLDIAALWLSLVTVRLLVKEDGDAEGSGGEEKHRDDYDKASAFVGKGDGVMCRRDKGGRLIVDIEISAEEGITVLDAQRNMSGFPYYSTTPRDYPGSPIMFSHSPTVKPSPVDSQYLVYATAELFGVAFSQGVNETQTISNLSSSRNVLRQVEINNAAMARLHSYYANYRTALVHQLDQKKPDLLDALKRTAKNACTTGGSFATAFGPTGGTPLNRGRNSLRDSQGAGNEVTMDSVDTIASKVVSANDRMLDQLMEAVSLSACNPHDKHVDVLLLSSALCREISGIVNILSSCGKDRASMGVTLENTRALVENVGVLHGQEVCQLMRFQGVRRMNVYANTGQGMFAFSNIQRMSLPTCYRPPIGCHTGFSKPGSDAVYFLERKEGFQLLQDKNQPIDFARWSPIDSVEKDISCTSKDSVYYSVLDCPDLLIKYPKQIMKKIDSPVTLANKIFSALRAFLRKLCDAQNPCVLNALCRLWYAFTFAAKKHPAEEDELLSFADEIAAITTQLFKCNSLDDASTFYRLVLPKQYWPKPSASETDKAMNEALWGTMHVFEDGCPIKLCMDCQFKQVLASPAVSNIMEFLFYGSINLSANPAAAAKSRFTSVLDSLCRIDRHFRGMSCPRYTPVVLFLLEGLSKAVVLLLVALVSISVYGKQGHTSFANSPAEGFLLLLLFTQLAYEIGQLGTVQWNLAKHLSDIWNSLDAVALFLLSAWALLCCFPRQFDVARTLLSLSAIPLSLQMLQYVSLVKEIGLLVLMIKSMIVDVMIFVLVYVVSIFGFGVCFYGLFYGSSPFASSGATLLYLFQSTLGNFDFDALSGSTFNNIGTVVLVVFLVLTSVLLVNLLIAQMSSTYSRIKDKSREEWAFIMASYVQEYILLRERTPLCLLPPPFNAITTVLAPLHYWALDKYNISIAGSIADYILGLVLMPLRFLYLEFSLVLQVLSSDVSDFEDSDDYASYLVGLFFMSLQVLPYMITSAVTRICYSSVRVVPAPTPAAPLGKHEASAYLRRYNIWYCVDLQQQEYAGIQDSEAPAGKPSAVSTDLTSEGGEDGFELSSFKSASASTSSPLHKSAKKASLASEKAAEKLVVLYTDEDIHRMFPADAQHHARRKADFDENSPAGANKTVAAAAAFSAGTVAAMDELRGEIASIKAAQAAAQAEARAAQEQLVALVKILADK